MSVPPRPRLTPQERMQLAQRLRKQSMRPGVPSQQRANKRRLASGLVALNMMEVKRKKPY